MTFQLFWMIKLLCFLFNPPESWEPASLWLAAWASYSSLLFFLMLFIENNRIAKFFQQSYSNVFFFYAQNNLHTINVPYNNCISLFQVTALHPLRLVFMYFQDHVISHFYYRDVKFWLTLDSASFVFLKRHISSLRSRIVLQCLGAVWLLYLIRLGFFLTMLLRQHLHSTFLNCCVASFVPHVEMLLAVTLWFGVYVLHELLPWCSNTTTIVKTWKYKSWLNSSRVSKPSVVSRMLIRWSRWMWTGFESLLAAGMISCSEWIPQIGPGFSALSPDLVWMLFY